MERHQVSKPPRRSVIHPVTCRVGVEDAGASARSREGTRVTEGAVAESPGSGAGPCPQLRCAHGPSTCCLVGERVGEVRREVGRGHTTEGLGTTPRDSAVPCQQQERNEGFEMGEYRSDGHTETV